MIRRRVSIPNELLALVGSWARVTDWLVLRTERGLTPPGTTVTSWPDFPSNATVFETDDAQLAAILAALASDGPNGAARVMAMFDQRAEAAS